MDRVYVGNLPPDIRIKDIDDFFRPFGNLVYIDVNHRANPVYALVEFDSPRNAFMAMKSRHGYNYDGYNLQLKLVENEGRRRRDPTPPPPPPSMFIKDVDMQSNSGGFGNNYDNFSIDNNRMGPNYSNSSASSFQSSECGSLDNYNYNNSRSNVSQYSSDYRMSTGQQNIMDYPPNNRSNISYSSRGRSNMSPENMNFSNRNESNMNYSNNNNDWGNNNLGGGSYGGGNANIEDYYANIEVNYTRGLSGAGRKWFNRYIREGYSVEEARAKALERRTVPYLRDDSKRNLAVNNSINAALSNVGTTTMSFLSKTAVDKSGNQLMPSFSKWEGDNDQAGEDYNMPGPSRGKWFNRYIREGYSAEEAAAKALERRTVPYLRDDPKRNLAVNNSTNAALENVGTTTMSFLSKTAVDKSGNQLMSSFSKWGGDNYQAGEDYNMPGPSRGRGEPRNAVSQQQYLKSLNILKRLQSRWSSDDNDGLSKKYHTQIVNDYENYQKLSRNEHDKKNVTSLSEERNSLSQIMTAYKKMKQKLLNRARRRLGRNEKKYRNADSCTPKIKMLMDEAGLPNFEAEVLAILTNRHLKILISMKADYDAALKKMREKFPSYMSVANVRYKKYRGDLNYLRDHRHFRVNVLSSRVKSCLRACLIRVHRYERESSLPLTKCKFNCLLPYSSRRIIPSKIDEGKKNTNNRNTKDEQPEPEDNENVTEEYDDGNN